MAAVRAYILLWLCDEFGLGIAVASGASIKRQIVLQQVYRDHVYSILVKSDT
jgi:hypothetical protein